MGKDNDYRTKDEKIRDFMRKVRWKVTIYSFIIALIIFFVSLFTSNKDGVGVVVYYPLALIFFWLDLYIDPAPRYIRFSLSIVLVLGTIAAFILGFFN